MVDRMMSATQTNDTSPPQTEQHEHLSAADIVAMVHGLTAEQQHQFYQAIGLQHERDFYNLLGICPSTNDSLHSQTVCHFILLLRLITSSVLFCSLAVLDPRVGHTMDVISPFIPLLCHSD